MPTTTVLTTKDRAARVRQAILLLAESDYDWLAGVNGRDQLNDAIYLLGYVLDELNAAS